MLFPPSEDLKIHAVWDPGVPSKERIVLSVLNDCELGRYALLLGTRNGDGITPLNSRVLWFPDTSVKAGGMVVVYTGPGSHRVSTMRDSGVPAYVYHWGLKSVLFDSASRTLPVLVSIGELEYQGRPI